MILALNRIYSFILYLFRIYKIFFYFSFSLLECFPCWCPWVYSLQLSSRGCSLALIKIIIIIIIVRQLCEICLAKSKDVYFALLDLEKSYNRVDRDAMRNVLRII